ncbi:hypothetical protein AAKU52_002608 [Pedobacter sp. CG_S7]|uniref:hypothetical protein n=1 Tax=Pedobacter sp. CG_S7 TaxID=3143930 RepID=UPI003390A2F1
MTKTDLPKAINLRELDTDTATAILEIQTNFQDSAASKAVVRAVTKYMPLYNENRNNEQIIRDKKNEIRGQSLTHKAELEKKDKEIQFLKDTLWQYLQIKSSVEQFEENVKNILK